MSDEILGWKPPIIRDDYMEEGRIATQADLDMLQTMNHALLQFRADVRRAYDVLDNVAARWKERQK